MSLKHILMILALMTALICGCAAAEETGEAAVEVNSQVTHYLLLGQDGYDTEIADDARTDTIVLVSLDRKYNRVIMTSILRDSQIENLKGNPTKANLLFKSYGLDGMSRCIENALDIEIRGAVLVNFEHVKPVIDALGGVDIEITEDEFIRIRKILLNKDPNMPTHSGMVHMTGRIALAYMRDRSSGMTGDFGRTERQRKVVSQLFDKCRELSLMELVGIYNQVSEGMLMNLSAMDILAAFRDGYALMTSGADFVEFSIPRKGTFYYEYLNGSSSLHVRWKSNREQFHELLNTPPQP